jgi:hypothetical protein
MATGTCSRPSLRVGLALGSLVSLAPLTSCASASQDDATTTAIATATSSDEEALSTDAYVTVARDDRDCKGMRCGGGGYWLRRVNVCAQPVYVSRLDLSPLGWSEQLDAKVLTAPPRDLVLRGHVGASTAMFAARAFLVTEAYRGMPGIRADDEDVFYGVQRRPPPCFERPCPWWLAQPLNEPASAVQKFAALHVDAAAKPLVDQAWLTRQVEERGALVSARFVDGNAFDSLDASQVFVRLPNLAGPCPMRPLPVCGEGQVLTYTRNADRCLVAGACVTQGICASYAMGCAPGYTRVEWATAPSGCPSYACDPAF